MRYYIIAGEASGDLHGSNLIKEMLRLEPGAVIRCWGGDLMQAAGGELVKHYRDLAFMGFIEVFLNLRTILRNLDFCKKDIIDFKPDAIILVDYAGFNLRICKWAKPLGYKSIFYISPQVWAWKENRVHVIKQCVNKMMVILPFEKEFYKKWNYEVEYVGHPLVEVTEAYLRSPASAPLSSKPIIALLPGSRKQEILKKLPVMLGVARQFPDYQFIVGRAPGLDDAFYDGLVQSYTNVSSVSNMTYELLRQSSAALVTSGTATLETALFGVPQVVCYKGSPLSYLIARQVIKVPYISLVNLIMNKPVVKELIQQEMTTENLRKELDRLLNDPSKIKMIKADYAALKDLLGKGGHASANAAAAIQQYLQH